jgi:hypothetical protein
VRKPGVELRADPAYLQAFGKLIARIEESLAGYTGKAIPVYVAGGAAVHLYTGARYSGDIDASLGRRMHLPDNLEVAYRDRDGVTRTLYYDMQYNDALGLLHEDAHAASRPITVPGVDPRRLDVRLLSPLDLAVSKVSRLEKHDREDILALAQAGLIDSASFRARATEALPNYVGDETRVRKSIEIVCKLLDDVTPGHQAKETRARTPPSGCRSR